MNKHAMNFGAIIGVIFSINFLITTIKSLAFAQYIFVVIIVYAVYKFAIHCRENVMEGSISYGSALWYVMQLFMYGSMISALVRYIFYVYLLCFFTFLSLLKIAGRVVTMPQQRLTVL